VPPQCRPGARDKLSHADGLDDVVVNSELQQSDFLRLARPHGEDNDRNARPCSKPLDHLRSVHVRKPEIDDQEINRPQGGVAQTCRPVLGLMDLEALELETSPQTTG
jgi:hypothetical protein